MTQVEELVIQSKKHLARVTSDQVLLGQTQDWAQREATLALATALLAAVVLVQDLFGERQEHEDVGG